VRSTNIQTTVLPGRCFFGAQCLLKFSAWAMVCVQKYNALCDHPVSGKPNAHGPARLVAYPDSLQKRAIMSAVLRSHGIALAQQFRRACCHAVVLLAKSHQPRRPRSGSAMWETPYPLAAGFLITPIQNACPLSAGFLAGNGTEQKYIFQKCSLLALKSAIISP
jgi:hypothetical protein